MMDANLKQTWIAALRSGKYKQGRGALKKIEFDFVTDEPKPPTFCCLGVLCDLVDPEGWKSEDLPDAVDARFSNYKLTGKSTAVLSKHAFDRLGLAYEIAGQLMYMNDRDKNTFAQIATFIEENESI